MGVCAVEWKALILNHASGLKNTQINTSIFSKMDYYSGEMLLSADTKRTVGDLAVVLIPLKDCNLGIQLSSRIEQTATLKSG